MRQLLYPLLFGTVLLLVAICVTKKPNSPVTPLARQPIPKQLTQTPQSQMPAKQGPLMVTRNYSSDPLIQDRALELMHEVCAEMKMEPSKINRQTVEFLEIFVTRVDDNVDDYMIKCYITIRDTGFWNPIRRLVRIHLRKANGSRATLQSVNLNHSEDIGQMIPKNSDAFVSANARRRDWASQKRLWTEYTKDVDISWADVPPLTYAPRFYAGQNDHTVNA